MDYSKLSKDELIAKIEALESQIENMKNGKGRKAEVLELLRTNEAITIVAMSERLGISTKNVSSQLTYLRQEGYNICTDVNGKKFLVEKK
jgi:biotin operon repressor